MTDAPLQALLFLPDACLYGARVRYNAAAPGTGGEQVRDQRSIMNTILLNALVAVAALAIIFGVWIGVHLLARLRMGARQIGCRGPMTDDFGNEICCHTGEPCDRENSCESAVAPPPASP